MRADKTFNSKFQWKRRRSEEKLTVSFRLLVCMMSIHYTDWVLVVILVVGKLLKLSQIMKFFSEASRLGLVMMMMTSFM